MKHVFIVATLLSLTGSGAMAQAPGVNTDRPVTRAAPSSNSAASAPRSALGAMTDLQKGANSFTSRQARVRLERAGLSKVTGLKKDAEGIWRGKAMMDGKSVTVGIDFKGHIGTSY